MEQKLQIIQKADQHGVIQTLHKYNIFHSVFLRWKNQFNEGGVQRLKPQHHTVDPELWALQEENAYIEALHSKLQRKVIGRFEFESIYHAQITIDRYYSWYNEKSCHGSLNGQTAESVQKNIIRFLL